MLKERTTNEQEIQVKVTYPHFYYTIDMYDRLTNHGKFVFIYDFVKKSRGRSFQIDGKETDLSLLVNSASVYFQIKFMNDSEQYNSLYKKWLEAVSRKISCDDTLFRLVVNVKMGICNIDNIPEDIFMKIVDIFQDEFEKIVEDQKEVKERKLPKIFKSIFK